MSLLTDQEIAAIHGDGDLIYSGGIAFARAIEQAVVRKLAGVSVEPVATKHNGAYDGITLHVAWDSTPPDAKLYTAEALAAVRVQGIEEAAKVADKFSSSSQYKTQRNLAEWIAKDTRALIGGKQ